MIWWDNRFLTLMESANLTVSFYKRFVDDGNIKLKAVEADAFWDSSSKKVIYSESVDNRKPDRRTADVVKGIADSVTDMLVWTTDFPSANSSGRLPILDIETWCEETEHGTKTFLFLLQKTYGKSHFYSCQVSTFRLNKVFFMQARGMQNSQKHFYWSSLVS